jgi:vitamin B12 transporter
MKKILSHLTMLYLCIAMGSIVAQEKPVELEEVFITDSRFKIKRENSGKVVHKISKAQIENSVGKNIVELIGQVAGIEINGSQGVGGQNLGYYVRGGRSNEVVILINGVQVIDPLQNSYDLRFLNLEQVASIEIIKGAASTLYGSGAATAVIDIRLKKAEAGEVNVSISSSFGTNNTSEESDFSPNATDNAFGINGNLDQFNYLISFGHHNSEGMSATKSISSEAFTDDPFKRLNSNLNLGYQFSDDFDLTTFGSFNKLTNNFDGGSFVDAENIAESENYRFGMNPKYTFENGSIQSTLAYTVFDIDRVKTSFPGTSKGENVILETFAKYNFNNTFYLILGTSIQKNKIETFAIPWGETELAKTKYVEDPETTLVDPYTNIVYLAENGFNINSGLRLNTHSKYGNHLVYNINPSYALKNKDNKGYTKFFSSYSSAFVAPSLQDLYASWGNLELKPQESVTFEAGIEFKKKTFIASATYFNRDVENIISYDDLLYKMVNKGDAKINGFEFEVNFELMTNLQTGINYTNTKNDNESIRIPRHKMNANFTYALNKTNLILNFRYSDKRDDTYFKPDFTSEQVILEAYSLLEISANRELIENKLTAFASIGNLLNEEFEEIYGYNTKGRNYTLGIKLNI